MTPEAFRDALIDDGDRAAAAHLASRTGRVEHDAVVVLGSGLAGLADTWATASADAGADTVSGRLSDLPGVLAPTADGHLDQWHSVELAGHRVLLALGRTHLYEGYDHGTARRHVTALIRLAAAAGATTAVLSNANGCLRDWRLGDVVAIRDHVNLTGTSPFDGTVFLDPRGVWDPGLLEVSSAVVDRAGTYAQLRGPEYQTMAETRLLAASGIDVVGMSTVHEALMASALGLRVAGLSVVSDLSFGAEAVDADTVLAATAGAEATVRAAVEAVLSAG